MVEKKIDIYKYITGKNKKKVSINEVEFIVDKHYEIVEKLGKGAYGQVVKARDLTEKSEDEELQFCAIKKIDEVFDHILYSKRCLRELKILRLLDHENVSSPFIILIISFLGIDSFY